VRPPPGAEIILPDFPAGLAWLGESPIRADALLARGPVLLEFWDFARVNSLRTLPYTMEWHARYADRGLNVIGIHTPGYSFGRDPDVVAEAVERLGVPYPVALDSEYAVWRSFGNEGWPARYLFDRRGVLRYMHYGEGEYRDAELVVQEVLAEADGDRAMPAPMEPLRPEDRPDAQLEPQTPELILPGDRGRLELVRDWLEGPDYLEAEDAGAAALVSFTAGAAFAVLSGADRVPGLYETDGRIVADDPGLRLHGVQFTPVPPGSSVPGASVPEAGNGGAG